MGKVIYRHIWVQRIEIPDDCWLSTTPDFQWLDYISAETICNHFTSILAEYGLPSIIIADFGTQYISQKFKDNCSKSGVKITFNSPYHHHANSLTERAAGTCKSLWKKAVESNKCPYTALWLYRVTPLGNHLPSPYELLYGPSLKLWCLVARKIFSQDILTMRIIKRRIMKGKLKHMIGKLA